MSDILGLNQAQREELVYKLAAQVAIIRHEARSEALAEAMQIIKEIEHQAQTSCADFQTLAIERIEAFARGEL